MVSFEMHSHEGSIKFANSTKIFKLAVSLGGAESLIEHVCTMTHGDWVMSKEVRDRKREIARLLSGTATVSALY